MFAVRTIPRVAVGSATPFAVQARNMATLKEISVRLKSVSNIAKITKSMKMIASTKVAKAQRTMEAARVYGSSATALYGHAETAAAEGTKLVVVCSSDRGLCGGIHSSLSKTTKKYLAANPDSTLAIVGQKAKAQLQRENRKHIAITFDGVAKGLPSWNEAALVADEILKAGIQYETAVVVYNKFKSVIAFDTVTVPVYSLKALAESPKLAAYEVEEPVLKSFEEFALANTIYWGIAEGNASEQAAKRTAMENATKNAGEMIQKLTLTYNRSRQATITNELIDIITGAMAV
ncbi:ATP synthase F1, gamma subunit [Fimicolochytrium jonesii]|uniref:ATP synthase F1, gamma subunit n=1 Tax=Fimicolochytrium jonesii TaxID=1396493 RepID=UPI0022FEA6EF|nr:ATP synthase F1, gamma subunit [Fimicolochytrium jonesii]KAI8816042.1 ATP synthase F1, gamma subunit [Fimicolochytrium jonesii]